MTEFNKEDIDEYRAWRKRVDASLQTLRTEHDKNKDIVSGLGIEVGEVRGYESRIEGLEKKLDGIRTWVDEQVEKVLEAVNSLGDGLANMFELGASVFRMKRK